MKLSGRFWVVLAVFCFVGLGAAAQPSKEDPAGYKAAAYLMGEAVTPQRNGSENDLLRGLRMTYDKDLKPFYNALTTSKHAAPRLHALLGLAEISPKRQLNLVDVAQIKDKRSLTGLLSSAIESKLIDAGGMAEVLKWKDLGMG